MNTDRTFWLVRHGNRLDFTNPEWCATASRPHDAPLSPDGEVQARETGLRLAREKVDHLFASPFLRAMGTAARIAREIGVPVKVEPGLSELLLAKWFPDTSDFLPLPELSARFPGLVDDAYVAAVAPAFPETPETARRRAAETARLLAKKYSGNLVLVGHGGSLHGLCEGLLGARAPIHTALCCLVKIVEREGRRFLEADGTDVSHLSCPVREIRLA